MADNVLIFYRKVLKIKSLIFFVLALCLVEGAFAQTTYYSRLSGNWNSSSTWSTVGYGSSTNVGTFPVAGDIVFIGGGRTVTIAANAACASVTFDQGTSVTNTLTINSGISLAVSGAITIPQTVTAGSNILNAGDGNLVASNLSFTSTSNGAGHELIIGGGTVDITGNISGVSAASTITFNDSGVLRVGGALFSSAQGTLNAATGCLVEYYGSSAQSVQDHAYENLLISGAGSKTFAGTNVSVGTDLTVSNGASLVVPGINLTVGGVTSVNGSISFTSTTGNKTFIGLVVVNGSWTNPGNEAFVFNGGITNNGTFSAGFASCTFSVNSQVLTGVFTFRGVYVPGTITLTNTNSLTVTNALSGSGGILQGTGAVLNIGGTSTISNLTATATGNTVNYNGSSSQTVKGVNYYNLGFSGSGVKTLTETTTQIGGNLTLTGAVSSTAVTGMTITGTLSIGSGSTFEASTFTHSITGNWVNQGTFIPGSSLLNFSGVNQSIGGNGTTFHDVRFSGNGTKTLAAQTTFTGSLFIDNGAILALNGITSHQANALVLNGNLQSATGTWGASGSGATNINDTYFSGSGRIDILTGGNTYYSRADGDWNNTLTWSNTGFNGTPVGSVPTATDLVVIGGGHQVSVTVSTSCKEIAFDAGTSITNTILINPGVTLTVNGTVTIPQTITSGSNSLSVGAGNLIAENLDFTASPGGAGQSLTLSTGTATISGNISGIGASSTISVTGSGILQVGGSLFAASNGTLVLAAGSTVEYMGVSSQLVQQHNYQNLTISGSGTKTMSGTSFIVGSNLSIGVGATLVVPGVSVTINGATTIDGTLSLTSATGTKTFVGLVQVNGTWSNSGNESFTFNGGITNNGTFTSGVGTYTFAVNSQALTGNFSLSSVAINGASVDLTNTNSLTVSTALTGTGELIQGPGAILSVGGTLTLTSLIATAANNTVNYTSASNQTIKNINYFNLGLSGGGVKTLSATSTSIDGDFLIGGTVSTTAVVGLTIGEDLVVDAGATFNSGNFNHTIGGNIALQGTFSSSGSIQLVGAEQFITGNSLSFHNLTLSGSNTKHLGGSAVVSSALSIDNGVMLSLEGIMTHQANMLVLNDVVQSATGTWGGLGSGAQNINTEYFSATGGQLTILLGGNSFFARSSGDWSNPNTWSTVGFNGAAASSVPSTDDFVFIGGGNSVTISTSVSCSNLYFDAGTAVTNTLTIGAGGVLLVQDISIPQTITSGSNNLVVSSGSLQADNLNFIASSGGAGHSLIIGTGDASFTENVTGAGTFSTIQFTGTGLLNLGGAMFTASEGTLTTVTGCTVEYSGSVNQTIQAHSYKNLVVSGAAVKTLNGTTTNVGGSLIVESGSTLAIPGVNLVVSGTTLVDGTISFVTSASGSKTFVGLATINGTWSNTINESCIFRGGITNNGTFNAGTGTYAFNTNSQALTGTFVIPRVTVTGTSVVLTNNNSLSVGLALIGTGQLTQAVGAVLNLAGTATITNLNATASDNIVNYNGTGNQTLKGVVYNHLHLSGSGIKTFQSGITSINGNLVLTGTVSTASIPTITIGGTINIGTGTTLTAPGSILLAGNFIDDGNFVHSSGTLTLNGSSDQSVSGSSVTNFYNLSVANALASKTVSINTSKNLLNVLTLGENIIFDADGAGSAEFSLSSLSGTETQDGTIGPIPASSSVTGSVRIERRMSPEINVWRYISSPVQGVNLSQFTDDMQAIRQSVRWYNESLINTSNRWKALTSSSEQLVPGRGYQVWMYQNIELNWDVKGIINQGAFTWSTANGGLTSSTGTTYTTEDKWNLIGNPYPSSIRWDGNPSNWTITTDEVASTIYITDESGLGTLAYNYVDGSGSDGSGSDFPVLQDGVIATGQSFWVYVLPGASITMQESAKVPSNQNAGYEFYRKPAGTPVVLNQLTIRMGQNGVRDEAYFKLNELATRELDLKWDAPKFFNERMNVYFVDDANQAMGMHTVPDISNDNEIRLGYGVSEPGTYSFTAAFKGNMDELKDWYFLDRETQEKIRLSDLNAVEVTIAEGKLADTNRFVLVKSQGTESALKLYPNPATNMLNVFAPSAINRIEIVDLQGNRVVAQSGFSDEFSAAIDVLDLKPGLYILKVHTQWGALSEKFVKK